MTFWHLKVLFASQEKDIITTTAMPYMSELTLALVGTALGTVSVLVMFR